ncbi:hypothetical protein [Pseudomonas aeruginosa]|uniref:hypothetical protein n=1 Tax=Pseudomonas aeruginosa TaxID=287 RepID=UPI00071BD2DB|nr:hypothetical protein [Pseudomonas aeruginosa]KSG45393.1 hypothetical protein AO953_27305 [Pseudomonas aeruginosa]MBG4810890.1 hypothetical protein [Pseudomonas aeruginosa]MBG5534988.1 hypothetical protein [Pseudomonas aeruginosa]MBG7559620.1 hypothetical protein [Pseudomonas aeruginosa]WCV06750.1 hypothetical protein KKY73_29145 [Pseudomonas aeruginosa]
MADTPGDEVVKAISAAGWLQGDIVSGEALIPHIPGDVLASQFDGKAPDFWMLSSHSCTVHARNFDDAPLVEWVAVKVKKKPYALYLNALNPRILQLEIAAKQIFELKIHRRAWTSRAVLPTQHRNATVTLNDDQRRTFSFWMSHAYNRIAMPDALVERLKAEIDRDGMQGIALLVDEFLKRNNHMLASAWVSFNPKWEIQDPTEPYEVLFRFLTKRECARHATELNAELTKIIGVSRQVSEGLYFEGAEVTVLQDFTMLDAEDFVRYNQHDWLSIGEGDEAPAEDED